MTGLLDVCALPRTLAVVVLSPEHLSRNDKVFATLAGQILRTATRLVFLHGRESHSGPHVATTGGWLVPLNVTPESPASWGQS